MSGKEPIKVSLATFFLIIAIIVIAIMGYFMYQLYTGKVVAEEKVENLNGEVAELEGTVNNLQGKIDSIANTVNSDSNKIESNKSISESDVRKLAEMHLNIISLGNVPGRITVLGFEEGKNEVISQDENDPNEITVKTNIKYDEFKNKALEYYSKEYFERIYGFTKNTEGYLTYSYREGGDSGGETKVISINKISDNKYGVDYEYKVAGTEGPITEGKMNITLIEQNGIFVINKIESIKGIQVDFE